jgi:hypothetical protein
MRAFGPERGALAPLVLALKERSRLMLSSKGLVVFIIY